VGWFDAGLEISVSASCFCAVHLVVGDDLTSYFSLTEPVCSVKLCPAAVASTDRTASVYRMVVLPLSI
jgi:hypothetical protein